MVNREYPVTLEEASHAAVPRPAAQTPTSADTEAMIEMSTTDTPGLSLDETMDCRQYARFDELGGWKMHKPTSPWQDGDLYQHSTPNPVNNIPRWQALTEEYWHIMIPLAEATDLRKDIFWKKSV
jgi:hypothetical protein